MNSLVQALLAYQRRLVNEAMHRGIRVEDLAEIVKKGEILDGPKAARLDVEISRNQLIIPSTSGKVERGPY